VGLKHIFPLTAELRAYIKCATETANKKGFEIPYAANCNQLPTVVIQFNYGKNICASLTAELFVFAAQDAVVSLM
jgi:hypothetical protein